MSCALFSNKGADISPQADSYSPSPLMCAVKRGHHNAVKFLLQQGSPIDLRDVNQRTCLHVAVFSSEAETLKTILQVIIILGALSDSVYMLSYLNPKKIRNRQKVIKHIHPLTSAGLKTRDHRQPRENLEKMLLTPEEFLRSCRRLDGILFLVQEKCSSFLRML